MKNLKLIFSVLVLALGVLSFVNAQNCEYNNDPNIDAYECNPGEYCNQPNCLCELSGPGYVTSGNSCGIACEYNNDPDIDAYDCNPGEYCNQSNCLCPSGLIYNGEVCSPSVVFCQSPWGTVVHVGDSILGFLSSSGLSCIGQTFTCQNNGGIGIFAPFDPQISGYIYKSCIVSPPPTGACSLPWGGSIASGASVTAYQSTSVSYGNTCVSQTRTCNAGVLSGSFTNGSCSVASNGGGGGGSYGGGSSTITNTITGDMATTAWLNPNDYTRFGDIKNSPYSQEVNLAYLYAYNIGSTTMSNVFKANLDGNLLRSHMAKMMVEWSKKVLGLKANKNIKCNFDDIDYLKTQDLYAYIIEACQMGLMGIDNHGKPQKSFDPAEVVTRGQFGTVLSRAIWGDANNGGDPFYNYHLQALKSVKIMTKISEPQNIEVRKWVMLMLHRTHKLLSK